MNAPAADSDLVNRICQHAASGRRNGTVVDLVHDSLGGSVWVRMSCWACAREALTALNSHGISGRDLEDGRLHVTG